MAPVTITMYRWARNKFGFSIKSECEECEINIGILEDLKQKEFAGKLVEIEIKPWLTYLWDSLKSGGWHAPVIIVNGRIFSQGVVINRERFVKHVLSVLNEKK